MNPRDKPLDDRVALVTGAGGPMGRAIAMRLAADGASLALMDISANRLAATREAIAERHPETALCAIRADARQHEEVKAALAEFRGAVGAPDILVNVVGGIRGGALIDPLVGMSEERFDATFDLNLKPLFWMVNAVAPMMLESGRGAIVNVSSVTYAGDGDQPEYAAAKAAVASLTRSLAIELAPMVRVNAVVPGLIQTSVMDNAPSEMVEAYTARTLLKRLGRPEDIAGAVAFLVGPDADYLTGVLLPVSGGIVAIL
jgi:3-oxoacyl-[acyl-carrier protein] reductase